MELNTETVGVFWGLKWRIPRKFVMERMTFEFSFEEWVGHGCLCPGLDYISISSLRVGKHCILIFQNIWNE